MKVLVVTGGHPFDAASFFAVFDAIPDIDWFSMEQPEASESLHPAGVEGAEVVVFYDMPGVEFTGAEPPVRLAKPSAAVIAGFGALCEQGTPMVFLHHAVAGWPAWADYAQIIGGRFHYAPAHFEGADFPSSGYRFDVTHQVEVIDPDHPICAGLGEGFALTDELYLFPVCEADVVPILRSTASFADDQFFSADLAIRGERSSRRDWQHPPGTDLVAWVKHAGNSPVAYLQFGDGPATYADPNFRRVLGNTISWAGSSAAAQWARARAV